jgi:hypothetical protein
MVKSCTIIYNKTFKYLINDIETNGYVHLKSITKFFVALAIANLVNQGKISYSDPITDYYPSFKYPQIKIYHILNHTSGLNNEWSSYNKKTGKYTMSKFYEIWSKSKNRYLATLHLEQLYKLGEVHYNNYAYEILAYIIKKVTHMNIEKYMKSIFFDVYGIRIKWDKSNNLHYVGFGLFIHNQDLYKLIHTIDFMKEINYQNKYLLFKIDIDGVKYFGHSGSGGQMLFFNIKQNSMVMYMAGGDSDKIPMNQQMTENKLVKISKKYLY